MAGCYYIYYALAGSAMAFAILQFCVDRINFFRIVFSVIELVCLTQNWPPVFADFFSVDFFELNCNRKMCSSSLWLHLYEMQQVSLCTVSRQAVEITTH